jgi:hypothetical protein
MRMMMMRRRRVEFWGRKWPIRLGSRWRLATIGASCRTELSGAMCVGLYRDILQGGWCHVEGGKTKRGGRYDEFEIRGFPRLRGKCRNGYCGNLDRDGS